jgi:hypothetical protein
MDKEGYEKISSEKCPLTALLELQIFERVDRFYAEKPLKSLFSAKKD